MTTKNRKEKFAATVWSSENPRNGPINSYLRTESQDRVLIAFRQSDTFFSGFTMSRRKARLLAKRINQMLDETA